MSSTENNLYNKNDEINQLILNISYETETGKLILSDNYNNHYLCDLFGRIKTKFKPNVTGQASYTQRQYIESAKTLYPINKKNIKKTKTEETFNRPNTSKTIFIGKKGPTDYHPSIRRFEGYSKFPRPLSPPFSNLPDHELKDEIKTELVKHLERHFSTNLTKSIILNNNFNQGLSYLTSDLNEFDCMKVDNEKILALIKRTLDALREKYLLKMKIFHKDPTVKALTQFSKYLLANKETTIINDRKLPGPNREIKKRYEYIHSAISRHGLFKKKNNKNNNKLTLNNDSNSNYIKRNINFRNLTLDSYKGLYVNNKIKVKSKNEILTHLFKKENDFYIGKKIPMLFGCFSYEEEAKKKQSENVSTLEQENKILKNQKIKEKEMVKDAKDILEGNFDNKEKRNKTLDIKIKVNNISFISNMSENEKKYEEENIKRVKGLTLMNNKYDKECNLLKGFKVKNRKGFMYLFKNIRPKYKNNGELYEKDIDLLRKTNPIAFKLQEKRDEFNFKQLVKKIQNQRINADNIMKGKKLKIKSSKEDD